MTCMKNDSSLPHNLTSTTICTTWSWYEKLIFYKPEIVLSQSSQIIGCLSEFHLPATSSSSKIAFEVKLKAPNENILNVPSFLTREQKLPVSTVVKGDGDEPMSEPCSVHTKWLRREITCHLRRLPRPRVVQLRAGMECWSNAAAHLTGAQLRHPWQPESLNRPGWLCVSGGSFCPAPRCRQYCYLKTKTISV